LSAGPLRVIQIIIASNTETARGRPASGMRIARTTKPSGDFVDDGGSLRPAVGVTHEPYLARLLWYRYLVLAHVGAAPHAVGEVDEPRAGRHVLFPVDERHSVVAIETMLCEPRSPWQTTSPSPASACACRRFVNR
jgi:hypothetical protein